MKYWEMGEFVDPGGQTIAPTTHTMVVDIQENFFRAYTDDWQKALLIINEATDNTARFKLATKYKRMAMCDDEEGEWHVMVHLEWFKSKIPGIPYGNKKGRLLVCVSSCQATTTTRLRPQTTRRTSARRALSTRPFTSESSRRATPRPAP
jgi:hypothetical protein